MPPPSPKVNIPCKCLHDCKDKSDAVSTAWITRFEGKDATTTGFVHCNYPQREQFVLLPLLFRSESPSFISRGFLPVHVYCHKGTKASKVDWTRGRWRNLGINGWTASEMGRYGFSCCVVLLFRTNSWHSEYKADSAPHNPDGVTPDLLWIQHSLWEFLPR